MPHFSCGHCNAGQYSQSARAARIRLQGDGCRVPRLGRAGHTVSGVPVLRTVDSGNIASVLERLHILTDSAANVARYRESVCFVIDGYNADPRELPEIPEVRAYIRSLVEA